jgi:uncharacterized membrane protein YtjA (UPF0391 family)
MFWMLFTIAAILMVLSIIAGIFGFRGIARAGCLISRIIFFILVAGFVITLIFMFLRFIF